MSTNKAFFGRILLRILFFKMFELHEERSSKSKLFQSMMVEGKNDFENFVLLHLKLFL